MNLNLADLDSMHVSNFTEMMFDNFYFPLINKPTRFSKKRATILDQIQANIHSLPIKLGSILSPLPDYLPVYMSVNFIQPKFEKLTHFRSYNFDNIAKFNEKLDNFDTAKVLNESNSDLAYDLFMDNYNKIFNKNFPLITNKAIKINNSWFDQELLKLMSQKDKLYKKFMAKKSIASKSRYHIAKNVYYHTLKTKKVNYYTAVFRKYGNDLKDLKKYKSHFGQIQSKNVFITCN